MFVIWVTCGGKMMSLDHGWSFQPIHSASCIHIRLIESNWAHWYAVHRHMVAALLSFTDPTWLRLWWSGSLAEAKWCHYIMVEASILFKLLHASIFNICEVFEHIDMLSIGIKKQPYSVIPTLLDTDFGDLGHLWRHNVVITSWLRLPIYSNYFLHPY